MICASGHSLLCPSVYRYCFKRHRPLLREFSLSLYIFSLSFLLFYNNSFCPFVNFMIFCASLLLDIVMVFSKITYPTIAHSLKHIFHLFLLVGQNSPFLIHLEIIHCFFSFYIKISSFASRGNFS